MNFYETLNIFGLNSNYTEEELNKKYYALAKKYHPDALAKKSVEEQASSTEKFKKINEAKDILSKALKGEKNRTERKKDNYNYTSYNYDPKKNYEDLKKYKGEILDFIGKNSFVSREVKDEYSKIIYDFITFVSEYKMFITKEYDKDLIDDLHKRYKTKLREWYQRFKEDFFTKHNILLEVPFDININLSINAFYENLIKFEHNYNNVIKEIDDIIYPFKHYAYYDEIKDEIEKLRKKTIIDICDNYNKKHYCYQNLQDDIKNLFEFYSSNKPLYLELEEIINKDNLPFYAQLEELKGNIYKPIFQLYYMKLKLEVNRLGGILNHYGEIREIENNLTIKYNDAIKNTKDKMARDMIGYLYNKIINFLGRKIETSFESLQLLNKINFVNYEETLNIYESVDKFLITDKKVEIYLRTNSTDTVADKHIKIDSEEYDIAFINNEKVINEIYNNVETSIISLDEFMNLASEFFVTFDWNGEHCVGLYRVSGLVLCIYRGHLEFLNGVMISNIEFPEEKDFGKLRWKKFIKSLIINESYQDIEKFKNNNKMKIVR